MKATKAYIASLGTAGVLLGAALLMLAVVSAVVAFDRWPDGQISTRVPRLVLTEHAAPIRVNAHAPLAAPRRTGTPLSAAGRRPAGPAVAVAPAPPVATPRAAAPVVPAPPPALVPVPIQSVTNPAGAADQVADGTQSLAGDAGGSVGAISPQLGQAVAAAGQTAADAIRALPLPDG